MDKTTRRTLIYCGDPRGECPFSRRQANGEGIPALVVDEDIYRRLPALLIATVDKFAQLPWNGATGMLFGQVDGFCPRHGFTAPDMPDETQHRASNGYPAVQWRAHAPLRPPDLIIQDELHLISGPLGTLVGLYESVIDRLASWDVNGKRVRPKVIASTATVRRAADQVHALFLRRVAIFPPQGLDASDSFSLSSAVLPMLSQADVIWASVRLASVRKPSSFVSMSLFWQRLNDSICNMAPMPTPG
jgi:hypothetical protein